MDERRHLDPGGPGSDQPPDQLDLGGGIEDGVLVLQPVPRSNLDDLDRCGD
jgi:hypothetical protein